MNQKMICVVASLAMAIAPAVQAQTVTTSPSIYPVGPPVSSTPVPTSAAETAPPATVSATTQAANSSNSSTRTVGTILEVGGGVAIGVCAAAIMTAATGKPPVCGVGHATVPAWTGIAIGAAALLIGNSMVSGANASDEAIQNNVTDPLATKPTPTPTPTPRPNDPASPNDIQNAKLAQAIQAIKSAGGNLDPVTGILTTPTGKVDLASAAQGGSTGSSGVSGSALQSGLSGMLSNAAKSAGVSSGDSTVALGTEGSDGSALPGGKSAAMKGAGSLNAFSAAALAAAQAAQKRKIASSLAGAAKMGKDGKLWAGAHEDIFTIPNRNYCKQIATGSMLVDTSVSCSTLGAGQ